MGREQRDMSGVIFRNDRKTKETHPDGKGSATIDGVEYWVAAWRNEKNGKTYTSLKFERKDQHQSESSQGGGSADEAEGFF